MAPSTDPVLDKISQGQPGLWRAFFNRRNIAGLAGAAVFGPGLQLGKAGALGGFFLVRWVYSKTEQFVPFTKRRHNVLLPSVAEALLGQHLYESFLIDQHKKGTLLDAKHPDTKLVSGVAERLIAVLAQGHGGGLLQLLRRDPDLLAMVMGHEIAHALARHNTEKMGFGIAISMVLQMVFTLFGAGAAEAQKQRQQQLETERMRRGYHRMHSARLAAAGEEEEEGGLPAGAAGAAPYYPSVPRPDIPPIDYRHQQQQQQQMKKRQQAADAPPQLPSWMSEELLRSLTNVLLELPFSRRAETEADLIGLKLMTLAGYNPNKGPEAFTLLASVSGSSKRGGAEAIMSGLGCTHPDSNRRAELLQKELAWMASNRDSAHDEVGSKVDYWSF